MGELICTVCNQTYSLNDPRWRCECGSILDIAFTPIFDMGRIAGRKPTMWRYREAIPVGRDADIVSFDEGFTPLLEVRFRDFPVLIKQDHLFPSASYKDRGASVLISKVKELGIKSVVEDSSGNAGCAIAAYCARAGIRCEIFVPEDTSPAKLAQIRLYNASLKLIPGSREDTAEAVLASAEKGYYASHSWNPFFFQGTKTFAYEVCEQLGWKSPDTIILPAGNGTLVLGAFIGFTELRDAGVIDKIPKIIVVQSENCAPLYTAFHIGLRDVPPVEKGDTLAEGIAIADPIRGEQILKVVRETDGDFITVSDDEVMNSLRELGRGGFCIEPTSAATTAGIGKYIERIQSSEVIVSVFTGHGLKSTEKIGKIMK
ncbi:MAG: threonine synthase [Deltaproteobacteria bacterium]|nr:threonine synthase [Deltaproteobacteria bacterium]